MIQKIWWASRLVISLIVSMRFTSCLLSGVLSIMLWASVPSAAPLRITINRGNYNPHPVAIVNFASQQSHAVRVGQDMAQVIEADLERSGVFRPLSRDAMVEYVIKTTEHPNFAGWKKAGTHFLISGMVRMQSDGDLYVEFRLWDTLRGKQMMGRSYVTLPSNWRRIAHVIADDIYERVTGEKGCFDTRIVYVAESGPAKRRVKRLAIMDQDGENHKFLTDGRHLALTPRFSPSMQQILYLSYLHNKPHVYIRDIETGRERLLGNFQGMSFAPRFSYSGKKVVMSVAQNGNSDIYMMDVKTLKKQRLTHDRAIDTSPSFSPDDKFITFNSDRGGSQQLYVMQANGRDIRRISFGEGRYGTPVWSPRGDLIAFTKMHQGKFYIGVMKPDGSGERLLANGYLVEGPSWAPNGRVLIYTRQERAYGRKQMPSRIYSIDLTGYNEREVRTPLDGSDPAWSPLLQ